MYHGFRYDAKNNYVFQRKKVNPLNNNNSDNKKLKI